MVNSTSSYSVIVCLSGITKGAGSALFEEAETGADRAGPRQIRHEIVVPPGRTASTKSALSSTITASVPAPGIVGATRMLARRWVKDGDTRAQQALRTCPAPEG